jgi:hypothetical protein
VGGEHDVRRIENREEIRASARERLLGHRITQPAQFGGQPAARLLLASGRRVDVDQGAREPQEI